jgi:hypothetical protein
MMVLREYEDFDNSHRPHRTLDQAAPLRPCQIASPTWNISRPGDTTERVASSTNIAWWHRFSAPTGVVAGLAGRTGPGQPAGRPVPLQNSSQVL